MTEFDYGLLVESIINGKCTLVIGPELATLNSDKPDIFLNWSEQLSASPSDDFIYKPEEGFFVLNHNDTISLKNAIHGLEYKAKKHYTDLCNASIPDVYLQLANLPFKNFISLSPDDLIHRSLEIRKKQHDFIYFKNKDGFYQIRQNNSINRNDRNKYKYEKYDSSSIIKSKDNYRIENDLIVLNLLGLYEDAPSMIVTFDSLFDFIYSIFPVEQIDPKIKKSILESDTFLFIGFTYEKWFLKLIFYFIEKIIINNNNRITKRGIIQNNHKDISETEFYFKHFSITFSEYNIENFIDKLSQDCEKLIGKDDITLHMEGVSVQSFLKNNDKYRVLYISSNYSSGYPMNVSKEANLIIDNWQRAKLRDYFEIKTSHGKSYEELQKEIREVKPHLIILSIHGDFDGNLKFLQDDNDVRDIPPETLSEFIQILKENPENCLQSIFFNGCNSYNVAEKCAQILECCIGIKGEIPDQVAVNLSNHFFDALFSNEENIDSEKIRYSLNMAKKSLKDNENTDVSKCFDMPIYFPNPTKSILR